MKSLSFNDIMNILLISGIIIYWFMTRAYIAWDVNRPRRKDKTFNGDTPWSEQIKNFILHLPFGKTIFLATIGTIILFFFGIFCGFLISSLFAILELILQIILRLLYLFILTIIFILTFFKKSLQKNVASQISYEAKRFSLPIGEFLSMFLVNIRETIWWVIPIIPYKRIPGMVRYDRFPYDANREDVKPVLLSAWFSYDLWKSLPFFMERPYPDSE